MAFCMVAHLFEKEMLQSFIAILIPAIQCHSMPTALLTHSTWKILILQLNLVPLCDYSYKVPQSTGYLKGPKCELTQMEIELGHHRSTESEQRKSKGQGSNHSSGIILQSKRFVNDSAHNISDNLIGNYHVFDVNCYIYSCCACGNLFL